MAKVKTRKPRSRTVEELSRRLVEAEEALEAIRNGEVDALVVSGPQGDQVYSLRDADRPYRTLVEEMNEGALTLAMDGRILYCNRHFADMLKLPAESVLGNSLQHWVASSDQSCFQKLLADAAAGAAKGELSLSTSAGHSLAVQLSLRALHIDGAPNLSVIVTDLSERKGAEAVLREMVQQLHQNLEELNIANEQLRQANEELLSTREAVGEQRQRYQHLFDFAPDGYLVTDAHGIILEANHAAGLLFDLAADWLVGKPVAVFVAEESKREFLSELAKLERGDAVRDGVQEWQLALQPWGGVPFVGSIRTAIARDATGQVTGIRFLVRDITERRRAEEEIQQLNATLESRVNDRTAQLLAANQYLQGEIEERSKIEAALRLSDQQVKQLNRDLEKRAVDLEIANRELEAFSYSVSHDLRMPLASIRSFVNLLLEENGPQLAEDALRFLRLIRENAAAMNRLIDDLLAFSRTTRQPLRKQAVAPAAIAREVIEELHSAETGRTIETAIDELPECEADPALLRQVFVNLLSNAYKFTRARPVARIEVGHTQDGDQVAFYVRDNGVGLDMDQAERLFGVFQRFHRSEEYEGTGVGLAIVERIIRRHGGRIWVEAAVDQGATFYFTLGA